MTNIAECPECGKRYKVPHFEKEWSCKNCEVALLPEYDIEDEEYIEEPAAEEEEEEEEEHETVAPRRSRSFGKGGLSDAEQREFRKRSREAGQKAASRRNLIVGIGLFVLVFGGGGTIFAMTRGRAVETAVKEFRIAWNQGNYEQAAQLAQKEQVSTWIENFTTLDKREGWNKQPPSLAKHMYLIDDMPSADFVHKKPNGKRRGAVLVVYASSGGPLMVEFARRQGAWCLTGLDFSRYR